MDHGIIDSMVRPDEIAAYTVAVVSRCVGLAGGSPVRVGAGAPGSRPQATVETPVSERGVESLR